MNNFIFSGFADEIDENFDIQLQTLKQLSIDYLEIRGINGKNISELTPEEAYRVKEKLDFYSVKVSSIGSPIGKTWITDDFSIELERFKRLIQTAKILNTNYMRVFSFYLPDNDYTKYKNEVLKRMKELSEIAEKENIILLHENEKDIYGDSPERILTITDYVNSPNLQLVFDFANFVQCGYVPLHCYEMLYRHVVYFHIKDALFATKEVVPPGTGEGNLKEILRRAKEAGFAGFTSLEPHLQAFKGFEKLELNANNAAVSDGAGKFILAFNQYKSLLETI